MVSFYEAAITPACRQGLGYLRHQAFIGDFYLAGGTALSSSPGINRHVPGGRACFTYRHWADETLRHQFTGHTARFY